MAAQDRRRHRPALDRGHQQTDPCHGTEDAEPGTGAAHHQVVHLALRLVDGGDGHAEAREGQWADGAEDDDPDVEGCAAHVIG